MKKFSTKFRLCVFAQGLFSCSDKVEAPVAQTRGGMLHPLFNGRETLFDVLIVWTVTEFFAEISPVVDCIDPVGVETEAVWVDDPPLS